MPQGILIQRLSGKPLSSAPVAPVAGYAMWFKAGIAQYTTAAGSTACASDNDPIGRWEDQSVNARNITQTAVSPDRRPRYRTNVLNGYAVAESDEGNNPIPNLNLPNGVYTFATTWTIYVVVNQVNWFSGAGVALTDVTRGALIDQHTSTPNIRGNNGGGTNVTTDLGTLAINTWGILTLQEDSGTLSLRLNKTTAVTGTSGGATIARFGLGEISAVSTQKCQYAECLVYATAHNTTDQNANVDYLGAKFGISV